MGQSTTVRDKHAHCRYMSYSMVMARIEPILKILLHCESKSGA